MKKLVLILIAATPFVIMNSCKNEPILPEQQVSFATDILPIIQSNCQQVGCHPTSGGQFPLTTYENIMENGDIESGKPNSSKLYQEINEGTMPKQPVAPLTDRNRKLIYIWIAQGAKNN
jgi:predicted Rdx family selenoprotein